MNTRAAILILLALSAPAWANPVEPMVRPKMRPATPHILRAIESIAPVTASSVSAPKNLVRPRLRPGNLVAVKAKSASAQAGFAKWIAGFRNRAFAAGITPQVFDSAFRDVRYDAEVIERDSKQSEFTKTIWEYLDSAASATRVANGAKALAANRALLERIEAKYGVEKQVVVAIWGLESAYGTFRGSKPVIGSLATLAYDGRRGAFFEAQLLDALKILQNGDTRSRNMKGSWAGAMGHTQFMPSSHQSLAVDFNGDGRRDIWSDDPTDALASTANYLAKNGWKTGIPWGVEVRLPRGFDYEQANRRIKKKPSEWAKQGVLGIDGASVKDFGAASVLLPAGAQGAAFLIFENFDVIERYNTADAYVIGVGHLADRIIGGREIQANWPRGDRALTFDERQELQRRLTAKGFDTHGVDGKIGPLTIDAVRAYQRSIGTVPDGYASLNILTKLR